MVAVKPKPSSNISAYFRHHSEQDGEHCDSSYAAESTIHLYAKSVLAKLPQLAVPDYRHPATQYRGRGIPTYVVQPKGMWALTDAVIEDTRPRKYHGFQPDVSAKSEDLKLAIEVFVSHAVDDQKREKVSGSDWYMLEIDYSDLSPEQLSFNDIESRTDKAKYSRWIHWPGTAKQEQDYQDWLQHERERIDREIEKEEAAAAEDQRMRDRLRAIQASAYTSDFTPHARTYMIDMVYRFLKQHQATPLSEEDALKIGEALGTINSTLAPYSNQYKTEVMYPSLEGGITTSLKSAVGAIEERFQRIESMNVVDDLFSVYGQELIDIFWGGDWEEDQEISDSLLPRTIAEPLMQYWEPSFTAALVDYCRRYRFRSPPVSME